MSNPASESTDAGAHYVQRTLAGAEYVRFMNSSEPDRQARSAFQQRVLALAPPGATLFDFGAGAGIDARFFAERGFSVQGYDADPRMRAFFIEYCRDFIDSGRVALHGGGYTEFLRHDFGRRFDLVMANFAPLNLVDDLRGLFARFHALTGPTGMVVASVLNPYCIHDMKSRHWWRAAPKLWRDAERFMPGPQAPHYLRGLAHFRRTSEPHFELTRVFRGLPEQRPQQTSGVNGSRTGLRAWLHVARCRYMFLLFEKQ
jgi:SAM-dependent methyltransferase